MNERGAVRLLKNCSRTPVTLRFQVAKQDVSECSLCHAASATVVHVSLANQESNYHLICAACVRGMADALNGAAS